MGITQGYSPVIAVSIYLPRQFLLQCFQRLLLGKSMQVKTDNLADTSFPAATRFGRAVQIGHFAPPRLERRFCLPWPRISSLCWRSCWCCLDRSYWLPWDLSSALEVWRWRLQEIVADGFVRDVDESRSEQAPSTLSELLSVARRLAIDWQVMGSRMACFTFSPCRFSVSLRFEAEVLLAWLGFAKQIRHHLPRIHHHHQFPF